jgi:hypothetical protein
VTRLFTTDAYRDRPRTPRGQLEHEIRRLRLMLWSEPENKAEIEALIAEAELRALDGSGR